MTLKIFFILFLFLLIPLQILFGQIVEIDGHIYDMNSVGIGGATIVLYNKDHSIVSYTTTDTLGAYFLEKNASSGYNLEISHISYERATHIITPEEGSKKKLTLDFGLADNVNELDEIILMSPNTPKDTVDLDLDKLNLFDDDNLKDILSKIPNFKVGNNGSIIYNGKAIEKILVNNKASFVNQNSIALESIEKKMIERMSVINNYQDDFTLDFEESQESVLNINTTNLDQNIITGSISAKYGVESNYALIGKAFLFSRNINAFLRTNTNNIGAVSFNYDEINKLIGIDLPLSPYLIQNLNNLFSSNENLAKDFLTTSDLTFRRQTQKTKLSGLIYHIAPDRIESLFNSAKLVDDSPLLESNIIGASKSNAVIGALAIDTKIFNNTIASINLHSNLINTKNANNTKNELLQQGTTNSTLAKNNNQVFTSFGKLALANKLSEQIIIKTTIGGYNESDKLLNGYNILNSNDTISFLQKNSYKKQDLHTSFDFDLKVSNYFMPSLLSHYKRSNEKIVDQETEFDRISRTTNDYSTTLKLNGDNIFKKFDYELAVGVRTLNAEVSALYSNTTVFYPISIDLNYENRLNRFFLDYDQKADFNQLESGINTIQPFNQNVIGNIDLPVILRRTNQLELGYSYNNLFDAKLFSISLTYYDSENELMRSFVSQENGISALKYFASKTSNSYLLNTNFSTTIFQQAYPIKIDLETRLKTSNFQIDEDGLQALSKSVSTGLKFESFSKNLFNFSLNSNFSFNEDSVDNFVFKSSFLNSTLAFLVKNEKWFSQLSFVQEYNVINNQIFKRSNINLGITYTIGKLVFSVDGRHLEELFSLIDNTAFNSQFSINNGLISNLVRNQSLSYLILGIKYNL